MPTLRQIRAWDKRKASRHEAGHVVYGEAKGIRISARIWKNPRWPNTSREALEEKLWFGRCCFLANDFSSLHSKLERAAFGLAGFVSERLAEDVDCHVHDVMEDLFSDEKNLSATDEVHLLRNWRESGRGCKFVQSALEEALNTLRQNSSRLSKVANILIRRGFYGNSPD